MDIGFLLFIAFPFFVLWAVSSIFKDTDKSTKPTEPLSQKPYHAEKSWRPVTKSSYTPTQYKGSCWVIDGDTIVIDGTHIRLAGIDAPEIDRPYGQNSKSAMIKITKGQTITAVLTGDSSFERVVADCFLPDGRNIAAELVKEGWALDWPLYSGGKFRHLEPVGIRKKLFEKNMLVTGKHPPEYKTVGSLLKNNIAVRAHCFTCDLTLEVAPEMLKAAYGDDFRLVGKLGSCRRVGCDGKAIFQAETDGSFTPLL